MYATFSGTLRKIHKYPVVGLDFSSILNCDPILASIFSLNGGLCQTYRK